MQGYHRAVLYNNNDDHQRYLRQRVTRQANADEEVMLSGGTALPPPGVGDIAPKAPEWPEARRSRLCSTGTESRAWILRVIPWRPPLPRRPNAGEPLTKTKTS